MIRINDQDWRFTRQEVTEEVNKIRSGELSIYQGETPIYDQWHELAMEWLSQDDGEYAYDGFIGFRDRSVNQILLDFHLAGQLIDPFTDSEVDSILGA